MKTLLPVETVVQWSLWTLFGMGLASYVFIAWTVAGALWGRFR